MEAAAAGPLERRVARQLDDVGPASRQRAGGAATVHSGRVDDVDVPRARPDKSHAASVADAGRQRARYRAHRVRLRVRRALGRRHDLDVVTATGEEGGHLGRVARRAADVGRPDPGDDQHPHCVTTSRGRGAIPSGPRAILSTSTVHTATNATVEMTTAPAAPVEPQSEPKTAISGTSTATSTPWARMRRFGLPIETGNDFDQP